MIRVALKGLLGIMPRTKFAGEWQCAFTMPGIAIMRLASIVLSNGPTGVRSAGPQ